MTAATQLRPFAFDDHLVRVVMQADAPWFVAADVCKVLGIQNAAQATGRLDDDERGLCSTYTLGGEQALLIISESGLYTLVLRSRAATTPGSVAHRFRRWVTSEVLPALRRTGHYELAGDPPEQGETEGLGPLSELSARARLVEIAERLSGKPAARALWRRLGLPWVEEMDPQALVAADDDAVARFAVEGVERVNGVTTPAAMLWPAFSAFCARNELANPGERSFFTRFGRMGFSKRKIAGRMVYHNIKPCSHQETSHAGN